MLDRRFSGKLIAANVPVIAVDDQIFKSGRQYVSMPCVFAVDCQALQRRQRRKIQRFHCAVDFDALYRSLLIVLAAICSIWSKCTVIEFIDRRSCRSDNCTQRTTTCEGILVLQRQFCRIYRYLRQGSTCLKCAAFNLFHAFRQYQIGQSRTPEGITIDRLNILQIDLFERFSVEERVHSNRGNRIRQSNRRQTAGDRCNPVCNGQ